MNTEAPAAVAGAPHAVIERISVHSPSIAGNLEGNSADRDVVVVLPPSYRADPARRYPVVYALHGYSIGAEQWLKEIHVPQVAESAFAAGTPEMILVFPDSKTVHNGSMYSTSVTTGDFEHFIATDLVGYIDSHYRTIPERRSRGLVGHSMGGYGATRIGFKHADTFGALYLMSPCCMPARPAGGPLTPEMLATISALKPGDDMSGLPFQLRGLLAMASAWSPDPAKPPLYLDLPYDKDGHPLEDVFKRWDANAPFAMFDQYAPDLKRYAAIALDVGDEDSLKDDTRKLHELMLAYGIDNSFELYHGTHTSRVAFRIQDNVLPFFGKNLAFVPPPPPKAPATAEDDHGSGPYPAVMEVDPGLARHVIYRPRDLGAFKQKKLGVYIWGNGGCTDDAASVRNHLMEIASHGYLVVVPGFVGDELKAVQAARPAPQPGALTVPTTTADLRNGLDWALAQNARAGSPYRGRIDTAAVAAAGFSCGGVQALDLATSDPRVAALIVDNSGIFPDDSKKIPGMDLPKAALERLRTPVLYLMGGPSDIAWANGRDDFQRINHVPVIMVALPVGHGGTYFDPHGGAAAAISVDWLEWQLRHDATAGRSFLGENCRLCGVPGWSIERKGF
ncbi:MAG: alpha/beta hydrolase-fold protein [Candidatus Andeanibacterium colombiense]|uniref:Alpha/beta hydrolase-fold protein n=1 Tax=Candidatus Andeanibacterium colombiense TaxID=3121345 RepID=A0AAJ5X645_9SPHN|nr:MAG: alpha/beta hydrolase-fold protein [Sphingomonadaceae bacterium]